MAAPVVPSAASSEPLRVLPPEARPSVDHLVTEDDTPLDSIDVERQERLLVNPLYESWPGPGDNRTCIAMANVGMFYSANEPPLVLDGLLSLDVPLPPHFREKRYRSYFFWEFGKAPDVVVEMVSNLEGEELGRKFHQYAKLGISYYVVWDPLELLGSQRLRVYSLRGRSYASLEPAYFPELGLGMQVWHGRFCDTEEDWLRWVDANGQLIPTGFERAEQERVRADDERARADNERARADSLAAQLRGLGVDVPE
jgi:Uma2 family endonuclease